MGGMKALGFLAALCLLVAAVFAALLASDVRAWQRTLASDDALSAVSTPSTHLSASFSERLLGVRDDRDLRRALTLFRRNAFQPQNLAYAVGQAVARSRTEGALAAVLRSSGTAKRRSQVATLLGILAYGDFAQGNRDPSQTAMATSTFQDAVQLDPANEDAKYDLELLLRIFSRRGVGSALSNQGTPGSQGHRGAGAGAPGSGY
jgi:hypothetical protein